MTVIAIIAQGMMGAGVGRRLHEGGAEIRTLLTGRSAKSAERARAAGMAPAADERALLDGTDFFLSILPPGDAEALARQLGPALTALGKKPVYVDCNAVSPQTALKIAAAVAPTGADFVDAGITKGTTAIACAMLLGAARFGCGEALIAELTESQPEMLARFGQGIPRMYDKAYRWVAEMEEISDFLEANPPSRDIYAAVARLYDYLATAYDEKTPGPDNAIKALDRVLSHARKPLASAADG